MEDDSVNKLVSAVQFGDLSAVQDAISNKRGNAQTIDANGCSLLHWACINNRSVHFLCFKIMLVFMSHVQLKCKFVMYSSTFEHSDINLL